MVKPFKRKGRKHYYFQVMINNQRIIESTGEVKYNPALKKATERVRELKGEAGYRDALESLINCLSNIPESSRDGAINECVKRINEGALNRMKLCDVLDAYRSKPRNSLVTDRTFKEYESHWKNLVAWLEENHPPVQYMNEITLDMAEKFLASEWKKGIAARSYNERITKFRSLFSSLHKNAGLSKNVWQETSKMKEAVISKKPLSPEQLKEIFYVADDSLKALFFIGMYTGLRRGDCCKLKWENIDFEKGIITVRPGKTKVYGKEINIPIHPVLLEVLLHLRREVEEKEEYVLPDIADRYDKNSKYLTDKITKTFEKAGVKTCVKRKGSVRKANVYGFHSFRHSFVSFCASGGVPVHVVMELVGHNSKTVHQIYQHASEKEKLKAIKSLPMLEDI